MTWKFLEPARLWWLAGVVVLLAVYVAGRLMRRRHVVRFSSLHLVDKVAPRRPRLGPIVVAALFLGGMAIGVLAMAQPVDEVKVPKQRATVMLALDMSLSMKATDIAPSRVDAAKRAAQRFVATIPPKLNVGLVSFNRSARVDVAPTTDRARVRAAIGALQLREGTAIGDAVDTALAAIAAAPKGADGKPIPAVIVLLSDGATTFGKPTAAAIPAAQAAKVSVWTIAYGTPDGVVDVTLPDTGEQARIAVPVDGEALAQLANGTGGRAYTAESARDLAEVYQQLGSSIGYDTEEREVTWRYIAAALALLGLSGVLSALWLQRLP